MRQLGARLPELPPVKTDVETPSEILPHERHPVGAPEPYPVEVHRIERLPIEAPPAEPSPASPEPIAVMQAAPAGIVEPPAAPQAPELIIEPATPTQVPDDIAEPVVETQAALEPTAQAIPEAQATEFIAGPVPEMQTPLKPVAGTVAAPQMPSKPIDAAGDTQGPPEPVAPRIRITEAPRHTAEPPPRQPPEPRPEWRPESRRELRPAPDVPQEFPEPNLGGRWAEFHDFRRLEPGRSSRISLEPMPPSPLAPRGLLGADREPEHRSSFLTIAVPGIAAILAVGALLWSGSLRDRVLRQDAEMTALQAQNRKLADTLAQMNVDQKVVGALNASGSAPTNAPDQTAQNPANSSVGLTQTPAPSGRDNGQAANASGASAPTQNAAAPAPKQATETAGKREGVSVPPPMQTVRRRGSREPVNTGYHPEIVPPYPTLSQAQSPAQGKSSSPPPAQQQTYHAPSPVNSSASSTGPSAAPSRTQPSATPSSPAAGTNPAPSYGIGSSPAYSATGNGVYASALAQNIEAVEGLQRQSPVPLREFHARDGMSTKITPGLFVSLRSPDQAHSTYALVVSGGNGSYQLRGHVNSPLGFADNATHRGYQLVILRIAGQEVYGYVRPVQ